MVISLVSTRRCSRETFPNYIQASLTFARQGPQGRQHFKAPKRHTVLTLTPRKGALGMGDNIWE